MNRVTVPWHIVYDDESPDQYSFKKNGQQGSLVVDVNSDDLPVFVYQVLGYTKRNVGPDQLLVRRTPARHPAWPWWRCTEITSAQGRKFRDRQNSALGAILNLVLQIPRYRRTRLVLNFQTLPYQIKEDADVASEFDRYRTQLPRISSRILTRTDRFYAFAEGPPAIIGQQFAQGLGQVVADQTLQWIWHEIPREAIYDANDQPTRILSLLGNVNQADYKGYPAGTLLLAGCEILPEVAAVQPVLLGYTALDTPFQFQVTYHISHFPRGWNKAPAAGVNPPDNWFLITATGAADGPRLYGAIDFNLLFTPL